MNYHHHQRNNQVGSGFPHGSNSDDDRSKPSGFDLVVEGDDGKSSLESDAMKMLNDDDTLFFHDSAASVVVGMDVAGASDSLIDDEDVVVGLPLVAGKDSLPVTSMIGRSKLSVGASSEGASLEKRLDPSNSNGHINPTLKTSATLSHQQISASTRQPQPQPFISTIPKNQASSVYYLLPSKQQQQQQQQQLIGNNNIKGNIKDQHQLHQLNNNDEVDPTSLIDSNWNFLGQVKDVDLNVSKKIKLSDNNNNTVTSASSSSALIIPTSNHQTLASTKRLPMTPQIAPKGNFLSSMAKGIVSAPNVLHQNLASKAANPSLVKASGANVPISGAGVGSITTTKSSTLSSTLPSTLSSSSIVSSELLLMKGKTNENDDTAVNQGQSDNNNNETKSLQNSTADQLENEDDASEKSSSKDPAGKPFECPECHNRFATKSTLKAHMKIHSGNMPHACQICGKKFAHPSLLTIHERSHSGIRPFKCHMCPATFTQSNNLYQHQRKTHDGHVTKGAQPIQATPEQMIAWAAELAASKLQAREEKAKQRETKESSKEESESAVHQSVSNKPFVCQKCRKRYKTIAGLKNHLKTHGIPESEMIIKEDGNEKGDGSGGSASRPRKTRSASSKKTRAAITLTELLNESNRLQQQEQQEQEKDLPPKESNHPEMAKNEKEPEADDAGNGIQAHPLSNSFPDAAAMAMPAPINRANEKDEDGNNHMMIANVMMMMEAAKSAK